jgi:hypothetical protein
MIPEHRGINQSEAEIIRAALERASLAPLDETVPATIPNLEVVARCECGCASVEFDAPASEQRSGVIADATGHTPRGGQVGLIVWGRSDAITGLEVYDLGAGDDDLVFPVPTSVDSLEPSRSPIERLPCLSGSSEDLRPPLSISLRRAFAAPELTKGRA